jgi:hypothetical protein
VAKVSKVQTMLQSGVIRFSLDIPSDRADIAHWLMDVQAKKLTVDVDMRYQEDGRVYV